MDFSFFSLNKELSMGLKLNETPLVNYS